MPNRLELPDELNHLIEKREQDDRRGAAETGQGGDESMPDGEQAQQERRTKNDRRASQ